MIIALAGNQNCGKTTLFNKLTGARRKVGNWPGVTVEKVTGPVLARWLPGDGEAEVVDLPGAYSLSAFSPEEGITAGYLRHTPPDVIVNVVDAVHLERSLYLTLQLLELGLPVVVALNLMDELRARGGALDPGLLEGLLGVDVVPVCARSGEGLPLLMRRTMENGRAGRLPPARIRCCGEAGKTMQELRQLLKAGMRPDDSCGNPAVGADPHWLYRQAAALMESDGRSLLRPEGTSGPEPDDPCSPVTAEDQIRISEALRRLESRTGLPPSAALASGRYRYIESLTARCLKQPTSTRLARKLDEILLGSPWSLPVLAGVLVAVFLLSFGWPGRILTEAFTGLLQTGADALLKWLAQIGTAPGLLRLTGDVFLRGVFSVLSFLPSLMILLFLLALLEDSGYLARAAVLMDRPMRCAGLSGRSLIPFVTGFGCTVPAALSARSIRSGPQRILTILLTPLMSCSAKIPVYAMICSAFFPARQSLVVAALYLLGILLAALIGCLIRRAARQPRQSEALLLEVPDYRIPSLKNALREALGQSKGFALRTFSVILMASLAIWLLNGYTFALRPANGLENSMLGVLSGWIAPLLRPCGFGRGEAVAALLTGLLAKESIISTLAVLSASSAAPSVLSGLEAIFPDSRSAMAFLVFVLLYPPCAAAMSAIRREVNSTRLAAAAFAGQLLLAWTLSMTIYQLSGLL